MEGQMTDFLLTLVVLASFVEGTVEYIFVDMKWADSWRKYIALAVGVGTACVFSVNMFGMLLGGVAAVEGTVGWWVGTVFTGIVIGRGSNFAHDFWKKVTSGTVSNSTVVNTGTTASVNTDMSK